MRTLQHSVTILLPALSLGLVSCGSDDSSGDGPGAAGVTSSGGADGSVGGASSAIVGGSGGTSSGVTATGGVTPGVGGGATGGTNTGVGGGATGGSTVGVGGAATGGTGAGVGGGAATGGVAAGGSTAGVGGATAGSTATGGATAGGTATGGVGAGGSGGAATGGGTATTGGVGAGGSTATGGTGGSVTGEVFPGCAAHVQDYNGQRGVGFNDGWRFNLGDVSGGEGASFDDSGWRSLTLPHDWTIETGFDTGGTGWYRKTFTADAASADKRIFIEFDGAYQESDVWINGTHLGFRPYGYSTFEYELTDHLNFGGDNVIAVRVDNSNQPNSRWYSGSGIYRNVWLTTVNSVHFPIHGVVVTSPDVSTSSATVAISATVQNQSASAASATLSTTVLDADGVVVASGESAAIDVGANGTASGTLSLSVDSPRLWSAISPNLYQVRVALNIAGETVDTYVVNWGFRTIETDPNSGILLNGQNVKLKGVDQHHDLGALGAAVNCRAIERQIEILKDIGVNAIRLSHNPHAPEVYEVADRLGMLLMDEAFDTWTQTKTTGDYANFFNEWAETDIKDMVRRDRNHPSVFVYSIGNEIYGGTTQIAQDLIDWVEEEDNTRLTTWGTNNMSPDRDPGAAQIAALLDMQGYNYAPYSGDYDSDHSTYPNFVIYGSEVASIVSSRGFYITPAEVNAMTGGSDVIRIRDKSEVGITHDYGSDYDNFCMTYSNTAMEAYLYHQERPFTAGLFIWSGFDYIGEPRPMGGKNSYYGLVDTAGFYKNAAYFYQSRWSSVPMVRVLPHWNWQSGDTVDVWVYTNCESIELFLNDVSQGAKTIDPAFPRLEWQLPFEPGTVRAVCTMDGAFEVTDEVTTAGDPAAVVLTVDRTSIRADGRDLAFITGDIFDGEDNFVATADNDVAFTVSGPGEIVGVDNGSSPDRTPFTDTSRAAFSGKVLAIVRSTGEAGAITVTAESNGLASGEITVTAQ